MTFYHGKSNRSMTGGKDNSHRSRDKRLAEKGADFSSTIIGDENENYTVNGRGYSTKTKAHQ